MSTEDREQVFALLYKQEILLAKLYDIFANQFPEHADFWRKLVAEEQQHALWIKQFYDGVKKETVTLSEGKMKKEALTIYTARLEQAIASAQKGVMDLKKALIYTRDYERSLIEKNVFSHFTISDPALSIFMNKIAGETRTHIQRVEDMIKQIG